MLLITEQAAEALGELIRQKGEDPSAVGLRLSVSKGGCAGLQYDMQIGRPEAGDEIIPAQETRIFVDPDARQHLDGCTLGYTDDLTGSGFRIDNPRAVRSCGCGTSFEPSSD